MRAVVLLGSVLFISWCGVGFGHSGKQRPRHKRHHDRDQEVSCGSAAPIDVGDEPVPTEAAAEPASAPEAVPADAPAAAPADAPAVAPDSTPAEKGPAGYRKETTDTVSNQTSVANSQTSTKDKVKVITKHRKDGSTVTIIKDKSKTKTKKDLIADDYNQTNHTLTEGGVEDSTSLTTDKQQQVKETDVVKKMDKEIIVTDKYGNVISDKHKTKEKEKVKKKEKDTETQSLVHTGKCVPPPQVAVDPTEAPAPQVAVNPTEAPAPQVAVNPTEAPAPQVAVNPTEAPAPQVAVDPTEAPAPQVAVNPTEAPAPQVAVDPTEAPAPQVAVDPTDAPSADC